MRRTNNYVEGVRIINKYVYGANRREVAQRLADVQRNVASGAAVLDARVTLAQFLESWISSPPARSAPAPISGTQTWAWCHTIPALGRKRPS